MLYFSYKSITHSIVILLLIMICQKIYQMGLFPKKILFKIVIINQDSGKREKYKANLDINNDKNDL